MKRIILLLGCFCLAACGSEKTVCTGAAPLCNNGSPIQSVSISSPATTLAIGVMMQFTATGHYKNGSTLDITDGVLWSTDAPEIAQIGIAGLVLGENPGNVNVTAGAGSITAFETVTVTQ